MTRLIFRFKRTLVTPTFPASSFTDVSTVPTRRHLSRELTEPSPPRRFHLLLETLFNAAFSSLDYPSTGDDTPSVSHTRCVPFRSVRSRLEEASTKRFAKEFRGFADIVQVCGMLRLPDDSVSGRVNRLSWRWLPPLGENHPFPFPAQLPIQERPPAYISATERRQRVAACSFVQDRRG